MATAVTRAAATAAATAAAVAVATAVAATAVVATAAAAAAFVLSATTCVSARGERAAQVGAVAPSVVEWVVEVARVEAEAAKRRRRR